MKKNLIWVPWQQTFTVRLSSPSIIFGLTSWKVFIIKWINSWKIAVTATMMITETLKIQSSFEKFSFCWHCLLSLFHIVLCLRESISSLRKKTNFSHTSKIKKLKSNNLILGSSALSNSCLKSKLNFSDSQAFYFKDRKLKVLRQIHYKMMETVCYSESRNRPIIHTICIELKAKIWFSVWFNKTTQYLLCLSSFCCFQTK